MLKNRILKITNFQGNYRISLRTDHIESKVDNITSQLQQIYQDLQSRIIQLDSDLRAMLSQRYYGPEFDQKERELRRSVCTALNSQTNLVEIP